MLRRQLIYDHSQLSPRKYRTNTCYKTFPSRFYYEPETYVDNTTKHWIGKKFIQWDGESYTNLDKYNDMRMGYISEHDIAIYAHNVYRILYPKSIPNNDYCPARMNIHLDYNNTILKISYF